MAVLTTNLRVKLRRFAPGLEDGSFSHCWVGTGNDLFGFPLWPFPHVFHACSRPGALVLKGQVGPALRATLLPSAGLHMHIVVTRDSNSCPKVAGKHSLEATAFAMRAVATVMLLHDVCPFLVLPSSENVHVKPIHCQLSP